MMRRSMLAVALSATVLGHAAWAAGETVEVYVQAENFNWKEFDDGDELLEESGPIFGVGVRLHPSPLQLSAFARAEGYIGDVDYDGQTFAGDPIEDTTEYVGARGDVGLSVPVWINSGKTAGLAVQAGIGGDTWERTLGTENEDTEYTEHWYSLDARVGAALYRVEKGAELGRISAFALLPFLAENEVDIDTGSGTETLNLEPEGEVGLLVEASWRWGRWTATVFYNYQKFGESDTEPVNIDLGPAELPLEFFQPESERHVIGLNVGALL
jgi:hypothetical protein